MGIADSSAPSRLSAACSRSGTEEWPEIANASSLCSEPLDASPTPPAPAPPERLPVLVRASIALRST
jgi:hypothetical protein